MSERCPGSWICPEWTRNMNVSVYSTRPDQKYKLLDDAFQYSTTTDAKKKKNIKTLTSAEDSG